MNDQPTFRFYRCWLQDGSAGALVEYVECFVFDTVPAAREAHFQDRKGLWVKWGMKRPHVTALEVWKGGRPLPEKLAESAELPEYGQTRPWDQVGRRPDPRRRHVEVVR